MCTRDRPEDLERALASLALQSFEGFEVILVDQSRGEASRRLADAYAARIPGLHYHFLRRAGLSRAYNLGVAEARSELVAFTDDDCDAPADWLQRVWEAFAGSPHVDLIYGQVLAPPEHDDSAGLIPVLPLTQRQELSRRHGFRVVGMGANFAARRSAVQRIGGFDEVLGGGGPLQSTQDFDFAYRLFRAGGTILLDPTISVHHYGIRQPEDWPGLVRSYGFGTGGFYAKHLRLGDARVLPLVAKALALNGGRAAKAMLLRRPDAVLKLAFLSSMLAGARKSLSFGIDPETRAYVTGAQENA